MTGWPDLDTALQTAINECVAVNAEWHALLCDGRWTQEQKAALKARKVTAIKLVADAMLKALVRECISKAIDHLREEGKLP